MVNFGERWRSGMVAMLKEYRKLMPHSLLDGHAMDINDANISANFNAISIGFTVPNIVEGRNSFSSGLSFYQEWMTKPAREPKITMIESAVRLQISYGYGFAPGSLTQEISHACANSNSRANVGVPANGDACTKPSDDKKGYLSPETFMFARSEYQYMRFGLGLTLMEDGFYAHELGDSWHGQDWAYDETYFSLGLPTSNATLIHVTDPHPPPVLPPIPLTQAWTLYVRPASGNATWALDQTVVPLGLSSAPPSARIDITVSAHRSDGIDLSQTVEYEDGTYQLSFYAKASHDMTPMTLNSRKHTIHLSNRFS
jgi:hypothetical protein